MAQTRVSKTKLLTSFVEATTTILREHSAGYMYDLLDDMGLDPDKFQIEAGVLYLGDYRVYKPHRTALTIFHVPEGGQVENVSDRTIALDTAFVDVATMIVSDISAWERG